MAKSTLVFICYRHSDGDWHADWINQTLNGQTLGGQSLSGQTPDALAITTYYDRTAPAVADWKKHHLPSLQSAHSLVVICTPGAAVDLTPRGMTDWVYEEIRWWIANRSHPPIVVDVTSEGDRWMPLPIKARWPDLNRVSLIRLEAEAGTAADQERFRRRWRQQIARSLHEASKASAFENVERLAAANRRLRSSIVAVLAMLAVAVSLAGVAYLGYSRASTESSKAQSLNRFLSGLFYRADPDRQVGDIVTAAQLLDSGARELEQTQDPETRFEMLVAIGTSYTGLGEHESAIRLLTEANQIAKQLDLDDDARFRLALGFGEALLYQNRFPEARPLLDSALKLAPADARDQSRTLVALGDLESWTEVGNRNLAKQHYERALALDDKGARPLDIARDANRLGYLALKGGDVAEAERRYLTALKHAAMVPDGGAGLLIAKYENDHAATLYSLGNIAEARRAFEKARATLAQTYGEAHGEVAVIDNNVARTRIELGDLTGVEAHLIDAIKHQLSAYGPDFSDLAVAYNNLGLVQLARGDALAAQSSLDQGLRIARANDMPIAAQTLVHLSEASMLRRDDDAAAKNLEEARGIFEHHAISGDWRYAIYASALGELALSNCDLARAGSLLTESRAAFEKRWKQANVFTAAGERRLKRLNDSRQAGCTRR
jgi:tetratricopeptide (TPR) repeat protein